MRLLLAAASVGPPEVVDVTPYTELWDKGYIPVPCKGKSPFLHDWNLPPTKDEVADYDEQYPRNNRGLLCGVPRKLGGDVLIGLDIDVDDPVLADAAEMLAVEHLGIKDYQCRTRGNPRRLIPVRMAAPYGQWTVGTEKGAKVEALAAVSEAGKGRQFIAEGIHPETRKPYQWDTPLPPFAKLPLVTPEGMDAWRASVAELIGVADRPDRPLKAHQTDEFSGPRWRDDELPAVEQRLAVLDPGCGREQWFQIAVALHDGTHGDEAGFEMFHNWSQAGSNYQSRKDCLAVWNSITPGKGTTRKSLFYEQGASDFLGKVNAMLKTKKYQGVSDADQEMLDAFVEEGGDDVVASTGTPTTDWYPLDFKALSGVPPKPVPWLIEGWLPEGVVTMLSGNGGDGKGYTALDVAVHVALGIPIWGCTVRRAAVVFLSAEDSRDILHARVLHTVERLGHTLQDLADWLGVYDGTGADCVLYTEVKGTGVRTLRYNALKKLVAKSEAELLIFDNASDGYSANENDRGKVRGFIRALSQVGCTVLLLAHVDALSAQNPEGSKGFSGSTAWNNSVRCRWFQYREAGDDGVVVLKLMKSNYSRAGTEVRGKWDDAAKMFLFGDAEKPLSNLDKYAGTLLRNLHQLVLAGKSVSPNPKANNNLSVRLKGTPGWPTNVKPAAVFKLQQDLLDAGLLAEIRHTDSHKKVSQRLIVTPLGLKE